MIQQDRLLRQGLNCGIENSAMLENADCSGSLVLTGEEPDLIVDGGDLPATACEVRDLLARHGDLFDRGGPVKVVPCPEGGPSTAMRLTVGRVVVMLQSDSPVAVTLPNRVARMYLDMPGEWNPQHLAGIITPPVLAPAATATAAGMKINRLGACLVVTAAVSAAAASIHLISLACVAVSAWGDAGGVR
jgi:hypothetical protein